MSEDVKKPRKYTRVAKGKNKRSKVKHPYLHPGMNPVKRKAYMDNIEYVRGTKNMHGETVIRALDESEKDWLNQFNKEYYGASIPPSTSKVPDADHSKSFHDTDDVAVRKEIWKGNNDRNSCLYNNLNARGMLIDLDVPAIDQLTMDTIEKRGLTSEQAILEQYDFEEEEDDS